MSEVEGSAPAGNPEGGGEGATGWLGESPDPTVVEYVKGKHWKDPAAAVESYRNLESKFSADRAGRTVVLPGESASEDERAQFFNKLGRPETPDKYEISVPEGVGEEYGNWAREQFHKAGLTAAQAKSLTEANNEYAAAATKAQQDAQAQQGQAELESLKKEWGAAFEQKVDSGRKAAKAFGMDETLLDSLESRAGTTGLLKFMANVGAKLGEDTYVADGSPAGGGVMTPTEAQAALRGLQRDDEFNKAWLNRQHPDHQAAVEKKTKLTAMAFPS